MIVRHRRLQTEKLGFGFLDPSARWTYGTKAEQFETRIDSKLRRPGRHPSKSDVGSVGGNMMQSGFVSAILHDQSLAEVLSVASEIGYDCVELMCWPLGG